MIRKPPPGWQGEIPRAAQFASSTVTAVTAGVSGLRRVYLLTRAVVLGLMAMILGWAALAAGLIGRDIGTLIGAGALSLFSAWLALRFARGALAASPTAPARTPDTHPMASAAPRAAGPQNYPYRRAKLLTHGLLITTVCAIFLMAAAEKRHELPIFLLLAAIALAGAWYLSAVLGKILSPDLSAIAWDEHGVCVRTLHKSMQLPWPTLLSCEARQQTLRLWGIIPFSTTRHLILTHQQNGRPQKIQLLLSLIDIPDAALHALAAQIAARQAS